MYTSLVCRVVLQGPGRVTVLLTGPFSKGIYTTAGQYNYSHSL
jgi:hypothetical protein